jgi:5'(3')-deoxyribonucleotidase
MAEPKALSPSQRRRREGRRVVAVLPSDLYMRLLGVKAQTRRSLEELMREAALYIVTKYKIERAAQATPPDKEPS